MAAGSRQGTPVLAGQGNLTAVDVPPSGDVALIAGRDVFKLISLRVDESAAGGSLAEVKNLRLGVRKSIDLNLSDCAAHPSCAAAAASGSTTGAVILWDLTRPARVSAADATIRHHSRTINRVQWSPVEPSWLLTASQDGTCRLVDTRAMGGGVGALLPPAGGTPWPDGSGAGHSTSGGAGPTGGGGGSGGLTLHLGGEAVRDCHLSPHRPFEFAAACEDGSVAIWDLRRPGGPLARTLAHVGLASSVRWHPTVPGVLASGGRDRFLHVWQLPPELVGSADAVAACESWANCVRSGRGASWSHPTTSATRIAVGGAAAAAAAVGMPGDGVVATWDGAASGGSGMPHHHHASTLPSSPAPASSSGAAQGFFPLSPIASTAQWTPLASMRTIASVSRCSWREVPLLSSSPAADASSSGSTGSRGWQAPAFHLAACASLLEERPYVFDARHPALPVAMFPAHGDVVTGVAWVPAPPRAQAGDPAADDDNDCEDDDGRAWSWLLSVSKDGRCALHDPRRAQRPHRDLRAAAISLAPQQLAVVAQPTLDRDAYWPLRPLPGSKQRPAALSSAASPAAAQSSTAACAALDQKLPHVSIPHDVTPLFLVASSAPTTASTHPSAPSASSRGAAAAALTAAAAFAAMDPPAHILAALARAYRTEGAAIPDLCVHNGAACASLGLADLALTWRLLGVLFGPPPPSANRAELRKAAEDSKREARRVAEEEKERARRERLAVEQEEAERQRSQHEQHQHSTRLPISDDPAARELTVAVPASPQHRSAQQQQPVVSPRRRLYRNADAGGQGQAASVVSQADAAPHQSTSGSDGASGGRPNLDSGALGPAATRTAAVGSRTAVSLVQAGADDTPAVSRAPDETARALDTLAAAAADEGGTATTAAIQAPPEPRDPLQAFLGAGPQPGDCGIADSSTCAGSDSVAIIPGVIAGLERLLAQLNPRVAAAAARANQPGGEGSLLGVKPVIPVAPAAKAERSQPQQSAKQHARSGEGAEKRSTKIGGSKADADAGAAPASTAGADTPSSLAVKPSDAAAAAQPLQPQPSAMATAAPASAPPVPHKTLEELEATDFHEYRTRVALDVLAWAANRGDVQTCVTVCRVLGPAGLEARVGAAALQRWVVGYIDILHALRLFSPASTVMAKSSVEIVKRQNTLHTSVAVACAGCGADVVALAPPAGLQALAGSGPGDQLQAAAPLFCGSCGAAPLVRCAICERPARGAVQLCHQCGHGGHASCLAEFFGSFSSLCPAGCGHVCARAPTGAW